MPALPVASVSQKKIAAPALVVRRQDGDGEVAVSQVLLSRIDSDERLAVAEVMDGWEHMSIRKGDQIYY